MKPLERAQLKNWREYLDFEIENGTHERVVILFERCMIACALYEDFWIKVIILIHGCKVKSITNAAKLIVEGIIQIYIGNSIYFSPVY